MNTTDHEALQRSYDRNLGYAKFWGGAGIVIMSLLFTFVIDRVFDDSGSSYSAAPGTAEIAVWLTLLALMLTVSACFSLAFIFWRHYHRDDAALTNID